MNRVERRLPVVDGLRALAVVAVVLFHGFPNLVSGGYIGVDVFFVISGFVIALRYLEPMVTREVAFRTFFARRVRRLVPAYFAMLVAATAAAAWIMAPKDLINFGTSLAGQALYVQNLVFWMQGDYFDAALSKPLLHTWSLGVEEQFYLCFPLLILALRRFPRVALLACLALSLCVLGAAAYIEAISPKTSFYWLPFRVWEFLAGIGAAMLFGRGLGATLAAAPASAIAIAALAAILAATFLFDSESASVLTQGLLAVAGTTALCLVQERVAPPIRALFTNRVSQHFGRISYSWYLWHWPPLAFAFLIQQRQPATGWTAVALTVLGYGLGLLSWQVFERGVARTGWLAGPRRTLALLGAFLLFCAIAGGALIASNGFLQRYPAREQPLLFAQLDRPDGRCDYASRIKQWRGQTCLVNDVEGPGGVLFIGDSHVEMQKNALAELGTRYRVPVTITKQNCRIVDFGVDRNCKWSVWRGLVRDIQRKRISHVVVIALWPEPFDPGAFDKAIERLLATGVKVVIERPTPRDVSLDPAFYIGRPESWGEASRYRRADHETRQQAVNAAITRWTARNGRVTALDPTSRLCPRDRCLFARDNLPLYSDTHHLTTQGVRTIAPIYEPLFSAVAGERKVPKPISVEK